MGAGATEGIDSFEGGRALDLGYVLTLRLDILV